jgi:ATP-dependent Clp protease protease subunit
MNAAKENPMAFSRLDDMIEYTLLKHRRLFVCDVVDNESMKAAIRKLWYMQLSSPNEPILIVINSPGGSVDAGFALWDQIKGLTCPVKTVVTGIAASMGSVLSLATANARIMIHQPSISGVVRGQASDIEIHAKEIIKTRERLVQLYVEATGQSADTIDQALERDLWMSAQEAKTFGLIDHIIPSLEHAY